MSGLLLLKFFNLTRRMYEYLRGGRRVGAGRKKKPDHLGRELVTIRLPKWMISQLKNNGEIGYLIENHLAKKYFLDLPDDYEVSS